MLTHTPGRSRTLPLLTGLCLLLSFFALRSCVGSGTGVPTLPAVTVHVDPPKPPSSGVDPTIPLLALSQAPPHVRRVIEHLRATAPRWSNLKNFRGGRIFRNFERRLPRGMEYREFDVHAHVAGVARNGERLVVDASRRNFYYTKDHYETFTQIQLPR